MPRPAHAARPSPKLASQAVLWGTVLTRLEWKWPPQQIAATPKRVWLDHPASGETSGLSRVGEAVGTKLEQSVTETGAPKLKGFLLPGDTLQT